MNRELQPLVSVVVPLYNCGEFLAECLESILAQTYENWDCLIVDNCSTDNSAEIAQAFCLRDKRVRLHRNAQFLKAVPNFNNALRQITPQSKYCKIVFADDWLFPSCLKEMVNVAEQRASIGIVGAYALQGRVVAWAGLPYPSNYIPGREVVRQFFLEDIYAFGTATSLLYRSDLVRSNDPFYNESNLHSDTEACVALLRTCDFGFVNQVLAYTRMRPSSLTSFTAEMNTSLVGRIYELVKYGPEYLSPDELRFCLENKTRLYYRYLARNLVRRRGKKFWKYHKEKLIGMGLGWNRLYLLKALLIELFAAFANLGDSLDWLLRRRKLRREDEFLKRYGEKVPPVSNHRNA